MENNRIFYHGSHRAWKEFDEKYIGTGNGKNWNGHGLYLTKDFDTALEYTQFQRGFSYDNKKFRTFPFPLHRLSDYVWTFMKSDEFYIFPSEILELSINHSESYRIKYGHLEYHKDMLGVYPCREEVLRIIDRFREILTSLEMHVYPIFREASIINRIKSSKIYKFLLSLLSKYETEIKSHAELYYYGTIRFGFIHTYSVSIQDHEMLEYGIHGFEKSDYRRMEREMGFDEHIRNYDHLMCRFKDRKKVSNFLIGLGWKAINGIGLCVFDYSAVKKISTKSVRDYLVYH